MLPACNRRIERNLLTCFLCHDPLEPATQPTGVLFLESAVGWTWMLLDCRALPLYGFA